MDTSVNDYVTGALMSTHAFIPDPYIVHALHPGSLIEEVIVFFFILIFIFMVLHVLETMARCLHQKS